MRFFLVIKQLTCIVFQYSHFTPARINDKILAVQVSKPMGQMDIWYQNIWKDLSAIKSYIKYLL